MALFDSFLQPKPGKRPPMVWALVGIGSAAILSGMIWMITAAGQLYDDAANTGERAAALQAIAGGVSLIATVLLLGVTAWYTVLTRAILRQNGPIVEAELKLGWLSADGSGVLTMPLSQLRKGSPDERYTVPVFAVEVRNTGNGSASVDRVAVTTEAGLALIATHAIAGTFPPFKLEGHSGQTVFVSFELLAAGLDAWEKTIRKPAGKLRAEVTLGSGQMVRSPWQSSL